MFGEQKKTEEETFETQVRALMNKRRITYDEAEQLLKAGQKSIWEF
ncbi:hypothetical protein HN587_05950 [Candidatus Woesearchaeota archaeon]|jgi:hypothetical protein|nr:hypothetical protein [Candidatus Woesearchaeota archaeon]